VSNEWEADGEDDELLSEMLRAAEAAEAAALLGRRCEAPRAVAGAGTVAACDGSAASAAALACGREAAEDSDDEWLGEG
jgi:hypothetical protein